MKKPLTIPAIVLVAIVMGMNNTSPALGHDDGFGGGISECVDITAQTNSQQHPHLIEALGNDADFDRNGTGLVCEIHLESCRDTGSPCRIVYDDHIKDN